jgi:hypothetical protein
VAFHIAGAVGVTALSVAAAICTRTGSRPVAHRWSLAILLLAKFWLVAHLSFMDRQIFSIFQ